MITKVEINGIDVSDDFITHEFRMQTRKDEVFASGHAKLRTNKIRFNIPPYSIMDIYKDDGEISQILCSSTATRILTTDKFTQEIDLLELTAILEGFIVGSKNLSAKSYFTQDQNKVGAILKLMEYKYGYKFIVAGVKFTNDNEYTFGAGATLFEVLNTIATRYDCRVKVTGIEKASNTIYLSFIRINNRQHYGIDDSRILNVVYNQDVNNYCDILETEATNVIDRNFINKVSNLTFRGDDLAANADNCTLTLPARVERIIAFRARLSGVFTPQLRFEISKDKLDVMGLNVSNPYILPYKDWIKRPGCEFLKRIYDDWLWRFGEDTVYNTEFKALESVDSIIFSVSGGSQDIRGDAWIDYNCLTDVQWNALLNIDKPKYCYYQSGSNEILGVNNYANTDLWHTIIGANSGPFTKYPLVSNGDFFSKDDPTWDDPVFLDVRVQYNYLGVSEVVTDLQYQVEYIAITDPIILNEKEAKPVNEAKFSRVARSYDKTANFIDYDIMMQNIGKSNAMMGDVELSIEYDIEGKDMPEPGDSIVYAGVSWYIINTEYIFNLQRDSLLINCCRVYSKVAEAIGVKTQFNEAKLPMNGIITRPILIRDNSESKITVNTDNVLLKFKFFDFENKLIAELFGEATFSEYGGKAHCYFETMNQYNFKSSAIGPKSGGFEIVDRIYVDSNNECKAVEVSLVAPNTALTYAESLSLPVYKGAYQILKTWPAVALFKDKRERLTFTMQMNNAEFINQRR